MSVYFAVIRRELSAKGFSKAMIDALEGVLTTANSASTMASGSASDVTTLQGDVTALQTDVESALGLSADAALLTPYHQINPEEVVTIIQNVGGVAGGTSGQIQYNDGGVFGGFTASGDVTIDTATGVVTIPNDAVTYAKMQNAAANTFIARAANSSGDLSEVALAASQLAGRGSTGDVAAIGLGPGLSMSGTTLNVSAIASTLSAYGPLYPTSMYPVDATGRLFPQFVPLTTGIGKSRGMAVKASLDADAIWRLSFELPPFIPAGTCKLLLRANAPATSGVAKVTPKWLLAADAQDVSTIVLNAEAQSTFTWGASGQQNVITCPVTAGGTGYTVGNILTLSGGTASVAAKLKVATVSSGVITGVTIVQPGVYSALPSNPASVTGGTGSSATFSPTWSAAGDANKNLTSKITLSANPVPTTGDESKVLLLDLTFNTSSWTLAQISVWNAYLIWE